MGFHTAVEIVSIECPGAASTLNSVLVDTGALHTWIPRAILEELGVKIRRQMEFALPDGGRIDRDVGYALVRAGGSEAPDFVIFAEPGDTVRLGTLSLGGLNLKIDPVRGELVDAGPIIAAAAA